MQNNHLDEIKHLLRKMQTSDVAAAERKLEEYAQYPAFAETLISILHDNSDEQWLKTVAASFLNNLLLNYVKQKTFQASEILKKVLFDPSIKQLDKRCFQKSLIRTLNDGGQQIRNEWQIIIGEFLKSKHNFDSAYLVTACFAVADEVPDVVMRTIVQNYFDPILTSLEVCIENANLLNEMVKMWIVIFDSLRRGEENNQALFTISNSQKVLDLLDLLYDFESTEGVIVCLKPDYFELNLLKYEAAQLNKRLILFASQYGITCRILQEYLRKNFNKFARTLHVMSLQIQHFEAIGCQDLLTTLLSIQQIYMTSYHQQFSFEIAVSLIEHQIFPFLPMNDEEREKFEESPEDFNSLTEDCCDKQTFGILKTEAAKLLETIGDKIPGCHQYVLRRAIESIKINLGFVTQITNQTLLPVQTSLLVLSVFSYEIGHYQEELAAIKVIICDERIKSLPPIEMSRLFTFLAYNYSELYKIPSQGEQWIGFAFTYHVHPTTRYCCFDFLSNIVDDYFSQIFLDAFVNELVNSSISIIWDISSKIIQNHYNKLSTQAILKIICKLFERIKLEITSIQNNQKNNTLDLNNSLHQFSVILNAMSEAMADQNNNSEKYQKVLDSIWPITELFRPVMKWDLEDEIVKIVIKIINVIPSIVPSLHPLVPQFIDLFKSNGYFQKTYLRFFNQFALKAHFQKDQQPLIDIIVVLKDALLNAIMKTYLTQEGKFTGSQPERITLTNILIILQNILAVHGNNLILSNSYQFFNQIGAICLRLLPNITQKAESTSTGRIIMSRALNTLFLCHLHSKTECFYDYLTRLMGENLYHGHDTLIFSLCVSKAIFRETDISVLTLLIEALMQVIERSAQKEENILKKKKGKAKIKLNSQLKKITDMDKILKTISSPFDEDTTVGEEVMKLFSTMNSGNAQMVEQILKSLTPESYETAKKYVNFEALGKKKRVIRKVVGIKEGPSSIEVEGARKPISECLEEDSEDEEVGPKRLRTKIKVQGKKKNTARKINPTNDYR